MIFLIHEYDTNSGSAGSADTPLLAMRAYVVASDGHRTADVSQMQIGRLGDGASAQDPARTNGGDPW
jgi:hypothetical protein